MLRVGFGGCLSDLSDPWSKRSVDASSLDKRVWSRVGPRQWLYIAGRKQATGQLITEPDPDRSDESSIGCSLGSGDRHDASRAAPDMHRQWLAMEAARQLSSPRERVLGTCVRPGVAEPDGEPDGGVSAGRDREITDWLTD